MTTENQMSLDKIKLTTEIGFPSSLVFFHYQKLEDDLLIHHIGMSDCFDNIVKLAKYMAKLEVKIKTPLSIVFTSSPSIGIEDNILGIYKPKDIIDFAEECSA